MQAKRFLASGLFVLGMLLVASPVWADQVALKAKITSLNGQVEWRKGETDTWKTAALNQQLESGDQIRTAETGEATLTIEDGSTLQLYPGTEFSISMLAKDSATEQLESTLALLKGRVRAQVNPLREGSTFEIETPALVAAVRGTTLTVGVGADGAVTASSEDGKVELIHEGENKFTAKLDTGAEALVEYDPTTGTIKVTCTKGKIELIGPDGILRTLTVGDTVVYSGGAATFIPAVAVTADAPPGESFVEPASAG